MFIVSGFLILIGVFTVLLVWLNLLGLSYGGNEILIAAAIGLIGAIIGGTISGALTLSGVHLSIKNEREEKLRESYPIRKRSADKVEMRISEIRGIMAVVTKWGEDNPVLGYEQIDKLLKKLEEDEEQILDLAMNVDGYFFSRVSKILINCNFIRITLGVLQMTDDEMSINYGEKDIKKMVKENEEMIKEIRAHIDKMDESIK